MVNRSQEHLLREGRAPSNGEGIIVKTRPSITGTLDEGDVLTAVPPTFLPSSGVTLARQWYRGSAAIVGETAATYTTVAADADEFITVRYVLTHDNYPAQTLYSKPVGPIVGA